MKRQKIFLTLLIAVICVMIAPLVTSASTIAPSYAWYTANPNAAAFTLNDRYDFAGFADLVNGTADLDGDGTPDAALDFTGKTVELSGSFLSSFSSAAIDPIGGQGNTVFNGVFDGKGKTITNFTIDTGGISENLGLFGHTGPASVIKNLTIGAGASLTKALTENELAAIENVGLLAGYCEGSIENCVNNGTVTVSHEMNQTKTIVYPIKNIGGLAGKVLGNISNCSNAGEVAVSENGVPYTAAADEDWTSQTVIALNIGGVAGCAGDEDRSTSGISANRHGAVTGCANTGAVTVVTPKENGLDRFGNQLFSNAGNVGGVLGYSRGDVTLSTNSGYIDAQKGRATGGIVGGLRNSAESSNFSQSGSDDGTAANPLSVTECVNSGNVQGQAVAGGIVGRAGSYTTIQACRNELGVYIVATRPNKPFPAGIVGSSYGTVAYCANFGTVASGTFNGTALTNISAGYYAAGIAGILQYFTDESGVRTTPLPEVYGCYNAGSIFAIDNMRQRNIVGDNQGYVHDNIAVKGLCYEDKIVYGDEPGDSDSSGTVGFNKAITEAEFKSNAVIDDATQATALSVLNTSGDRDGWVYYWARPSGTINSGYPALNTQTAGNTDISAAAVSLAGNAQFTGLDAVPKAAVTFNGVPLTQGIDFKVVPQPGASEVSPAGTTPYAAHIVAIGSTYSGTAVQTLPYGIAAGDLANCTVLIDSKQFNWEPQTVSAGDVHVKNLAGIELEPGDYTFAFDPADADLTVQDGGGKAAVNAKKYTIDITADPGSSHFAGTVTGEFTIKAARIMWSPEDTDDSQNAHPQKISHLGTEYNWQSLTLTPNVADDDLVLKVEYTGYPIHPEVMSVTYLGRELTQGQGQEAGKDYRVIYGETMDGITPDLGIENVGAEGGSGTGTITVRYITGSNFSNYDNMKFLIVDTDAKNDLAGAVIKGGGDIIFEPGADYEPIEVWYAGSKITQGVDYTISYTDNDKPGAASYTITGIGDNFEGTKSGAFNLVEGRTYAIEYRYDDAAKTASVTGAEYFGTRASFELDIPATVEKDGAVYAVTSIADAAFGNSTGTAITATAKKISAVSIPMTVKTIGQYAFGAAAAGLMTNLTAVVFDEHSQLETIGDAAFSYTGLTEITIPAKVSAIARRAFRNIPTLAKITFLSGEADKPAISDTGLTGSGTFANIAGSVDVYGYDQATGVKAFCESKAGWTWHSLGAAPAAASFTVSFDSKGGGAVASQAVVPGGFAPRPAPNPAFAGYAFAGWYASSDGGATLHENAFAFESMPITANLTLYAKWDETAGPSAGGPGSGDFDGDGLVTFADVTAALQAIVGARQLTQAQHDALDMDGDGLITMIDVTRILQKLVGMNIGSVPVDKNVLEPVPEPEPVPELVSEVRSLPEPIPPAITEDELPAYEAPQSPDPAVAADPEEQGGTKTEEQGDGE